MAHYDQFRYKQITANKRAVAIVMNELHYPSYEKVIHCYDNDGFSSWDGVFIPWRRVKKVRVYG